MSLFNIPPRHIFPVLIMSSVSIACFPAYFHTPYAIHEMFRLPKRIADSPTAHSPFIFMTARIHAIAFMMDAFYLQGNHAAVDTVMFILGTWIIAVDVWICLREGVNGTAVFRGVSGGLVGLWGLYGMKAMSYISRKALHKIYANFNIGKSTKKNRDSNNPIHPCATHVTNLLTILRSSDAWTNKS